MCVCVSVCVCVAPACLSHTRGSACSCWGFGRQWLPASFSLQYINWFYCHGDETLGVINFFNLVKMSQDGAGRIFGAGGGCRASGRAAGCHQVTCCILALFLFSCPFRRFVALRSEWKRILIPAQFLFCLTCRRCLEVWIIIQTCSDINLLEDLRSPLHDPTDRTGSVCPSDVLSTFVPAEDGNSWSSGWKMGMKSE